MTQPVSGISEGGDLFKFHRCKENIPYLLNGKIYHIGLLETQQRQLCAATSTIPPFVWEKQEEEVHQIRFMFGILRLYM